MAVPFDPTLLRPGDTMLYRPCGFSWRQPFGWIFGKVIALKTWHSISHVEIFIGFNRGDHTSLASRDGLGVNGYPLRLTELAYVLRPVPGVAESFDLAAGLRWFDTVRGQRYDWWGLARFAGFHPSSTTRMFCSAFWLRFYRSCGFNPFSRRIDADSISPGQIPDCPKLDVVWDDGKDPDYSESTPLLTPAPA